MSKIKDFDENGYTLILTLQEDFELSARL